MIKQRLIWKNLFFTIATLFNNSNVAYRLPLPGAMNIEIYTQKVMFS